MPGKYAHEVTVSRLPAVSESASRNDFGQRTTAGTSSTIYSGQADYQDMSFRERRASFGDEAVASAGWVYFPLGCFPSSIRTDDRATIEGDEVTLAGVVVDVDRLSQRVLVRIEAEPSNA